MDWDFFVVVFKTQIQFLYFSRCVQVFYFFLDLFSIYDKFIQAPFEAAGERSLRFTPASLHWRDSGPGGLQECRPHHRTLAKVHTRDRQSQRLGNVKISNSESQQLESQENQYCAWRQRHEEQKWGGRTIPVSFLSFSFSFYFSK